MKAKHRKMLIELMDYCNQLGGTLDGTSTSETKYRDRQRAHMHTYKILLAILGDHPENDQNEYYFEMAKEALEEMKILTKKVYLDRNGN